MPSASFGSEIYRMRKLLLDLYSLHMQVVFGDSSSPYLLNSTIRYHLQQHLSSHLELLQKLTDSSYIDDIITSAPTFHLYYESKRVLILKCGPFNVRKFQTNSWQPQQRIKAVEGRSFKEDLPLPPTHRLEKTYSDIMLDKPHSHESATVKVLGVIWDPEQDCLYTV